MKMTLDRKKAYWMGLGVVVIVLLVLIVINQYPTVISSTMSPEVIVIGQDQKVTITVTVKPKFLFTPKLKAVMAEQGYQGNPSSQADWLKFFSEFKLNPKALGNLTNTGKDSQGNTVYSGTFSIGESTAQTLEIQPTNMFGVNLLTHDNAQLSKLAVTTRVTASLPPDPGEAGKQTLEGIDSDKDGLRDDVQREIMFLAPESEKLRMALRQTALPYQDLVSKPSLSPKDVDGLLQKFFSGSACFRVLLAGDPSTYLTYSIPKSYKADIDLSQLFDTIKNTETRAQWFNENDSKHGAGSTGIDSVDRCSFNPSDYQD